MNQRFQNLTTVPVPVLTAFESIQVFFPCGFEDFMEKGERKLL